MTFIATTSLMDLSHFLYFLLLVIAIASCWFAKKQVTIVFALAAGGLGVWLSHIHLLGVMSLMGMGAYIVAYSKFDGKHWIKALFFSVLVILVVPFYEHMIPGFQNFLLATDVHLSPDSKAYQFYVNADKVFVGLMLLMIVLIPNKSLKDWQETVRVLPLSFIGVCFVLLGTAFLAHYIRFDFKVPVILWWWVPANLFLVCVCEEIFFRGFIQNQLVALLKPFRWGKWMALASASLFFGLCHYGGGFIYVLLATLAGLGYGYVYLRSQRIESSILLHFSVNLVHIVVFSYPALMR